MPRTDEYKRNKRLIGDDINYPGSKKARFEKETTVDPAVEKQQKLASDANENFVVENLNIDIGRCNDLG